MLDSVLETFQIVPDYDLNIMKRGQTLEAVTGRILEGLGEILDREEPDLVLVARMMPQPLSPRLCPRSITEFRWDMWRPGLRTYDLYAPYPEEANRQMVGNLRRSCILPRLCGA